MGRITSTRWLLLAILLVLVGRGWCAAPPTQLTPAQVKSLQASERSRCDLLEWLAELLEKREDWREAEKARVEVLGVLRSALGERHWQVVDARWKLRDAKGRAAMSALKRKQLARAAALNTQVIRLYRAGNVAQAVAAGGEALKIHKEVLGEKHPNTATSLNNLAMLHQAMRDQKQALPLFQQAMKITKEVLGEKHPSYATSLNNLAILYKDMGDHKQALPLFQEAMKLRKEVLGEKHPDYAQSLNNLAALYEDMGDHKQALPLFQQAMKITREVLGEKHPSYATNLNNLAMVYKAMGDHKQALPLYLLAMKLRKELLGEKHPDYAQSLNNLALLYQARGDHKQALPLFQQAMKITKEVLGEKHPDYADSLNNLALLYQAMGDYKQALPLYLQAMKIDKEALGEKHPDYATSLDNLGLLYQAMGDHKQALPLFQEAMKLRKDVLGEKHPHYALSLNNLAMLYQARGDHKQALPLYLLAMKLRKELLGEKHPSYADSLNNLALLYKDMGDYKQALPLFQQAIKLRKEVLGEKHPHYATNLNNLAILYKAMGDYKQALPLFQQAMKIYKEALGEKHPRYATNLNNLAMLYQDMGDHKQALLLSQQAMKITKEVLGEKHSSYATSVNNLAMLYYAIGDHKQALPLFLLAMKIRKEVLGEKHPDYASSLNNLAMLYKAMGDHKQALPLFRLAMKIYKEALGEKHPSSATSLNNLAELYKAMGDHKQALSFYKQAMNIRKDVLGEKHPSYAISLHNLAALYQAMKKEEEAVRLSDLALNITLANLRDSASVQSQRQQLAASEDLRYRLDLRLSFAAGGVSVYQHVLACKGAVFLLQQERHLFARLLADARPEVRHTVEELRQTTRSLASLALAPVDPRTVAVRREQMEKLTREQEDLEGKLSRLADDFRQTRRQEQLGVEALQRALPEGAALVDFLFYTHMDPTQTDKGKRFQRRLTAFVVRNGKAVVRLDLGPARAIEEAVRDWRLSVLRRGRGGLAAQKLRKDLWLPVEKHLSGATVVLISPDEALAGLPFAALPGSKPGSFLLEDVALAVVPVPRALPSLLAPAPKESRLKPSLLVVGDVDFDSAAIAVASADDRSAPRGSLKGWRKLPNTRAEASDVKDSFSRLFKGGAVTDLREEEARKKAVREGLQKHRYAHLATHGFFAPAELKSALGGSERSEDLFGKGGVQGWHPLLLSGIVLAGANKDPKPGEEDGILTALEVSEMDLSRLELAVLSACETGLGKTAGGEGVLGLQRAFQVAGARSVVASLWQVDDKATQELMGAFYKAYWDRKKVVSRVEALRQAQLSMLREGYKRGLVRRIDKDEDKRVPPLFWAAFVLSGDWR